MIVKGRFGPRTLIISTLLLLSLPVMTAIAEGSGPSYAPYEDVLDPYLRKVLNTKDTGTDIRVLVQFRNWPISEDVEVAKGLGLEHISSLKFVPAALFQGSRAEVLSLSGYPRTRWIEYDGEMELLMEVSTSTINATVVWNTWIESAKREFPQIDGEGITVAVVDTGIDAGHPDLDYGEKTIINIKSDIPGGPWYELENSDTSYGHGTHVAGTIAGNGDASAGARSGVAPAAKLIGLCIGDVVITLTNTIQGLEWVYENSKPPNPHNIKVVSNSWGGGAAEYDPEDATSIICQKMTYENNVLVVFAMGNAGSGHHTGDVLTASPTGLIPSNIGVAAFERDGSGIAYFSSRGEKGKNQTYPDIGAPGVKIWSAHARLTEISAMSKLQGNPNPYYLAISGTSMATPHVSGLAALMFQAAPSLTISDRYEDYSGEDPDTWYSNSFNRIHEVEWIMEQSARYLSPDGLPLSDETNDNGVPEPQDMGPTEVGWDGKPMDWAQGYGLIDAEKCVGICLTLQHLREVYPSEKWTPNDAIEVYYGRQVFHDTSRDLSTDNLQTSWEAEFARYAQDQDIPLLVQNQSRLVWVPEGAVEMRIILSFDAVQLNQRTVGDLTFVVDYGYDGTFDYEHPFFGSATTGTKETVLQIDQGQSDQYWAIGVYGRGFKVLRPLQDREYMELRIPYSIGVTLKMDVGANGTMDVAPPKPNSMVSLWEEGPPSPEYSGGALVLHGTVFDVSRMAPLPPPEEGPEAKGFPWLWVLLIVVVIIAIGAMVYYKNKKARTGRKT